MRATVQLVTNRVLLRPGHFTAKKNGAEASLYLAYMVRKRIGRLIQF